MRVSASTSPCVDRDVTGPTVPGNLDETTVAQTSISVSWTASTDDVGVAAYALYRDGILDGFVVASFLPTLGAVFERLSCGATYSLGVVAIDAAGNRSGIATMAGTTAECTSAAATVDVAPTGSDSDPCTQAAPCATFNRAYHVAQPGDTVQVAAGNYPEQVITPDESKTSSADVVFQPAPGATVQVGTYGNPAIGIDVRGASHLTVKGIKAGYVEATFSDQYCCAFGPDSHFASDVTFDSMTVNAAYVSSGQQVTIQNSDIGNYSVADDGIHLGTAIRITSATSSSQYPAPIVSYLTLKNNLIHNLVHPSGVATHAACLYFANAFSQHITITGNKFTHCAIIDLELGPSDDVTVENNWFDLPTLADDACCSLQTIALDTGPGDPSTVLSNVRIAYNSFKGWITTNADTYTNVAVEHNVWESPRGCFYGGNRVTYSRNVKGGPDAVKCGPTDILAPTGWPNDSGPYSNAVFDFHLKAGAAAIDAGDRRGAPKRDIDGNRRPFGRAPDAGADERTK